MTISQLDGPTISSVTPMFHVEHLERSDMPDRTEGPSQRMLRASQPLHAGPDS